MYYPARTDSLTHRKRMLSVRRGIVLALLATVTILLAARSFTYTTWYRDWRYGRLSVEQLAQTVREHPSDTVALYHYGKALNKQRRYSEALVPLEKAVGLDPDSARLRDEWSLAQLAGGYITGAFGQLTQFTHTHPNSAEGHFLLGRFYVSQNAYARATEEIEKAVQLKPDFGDAWSLLAGARLQMGGMALARDAARKAVALRPNSAVDHMLLASLLVATDLPQEARQEYEKAVTLAPDEPAYRIEYASLLLKSADPRDFPRAEEEARRAVALDPNDTTAYYLLGRSLVLERRIADAIEPLKTAATMLPPGTPRSTLAANAPELFLNPAPAQELSRAYRIQGDLTAADDWQKMYLKRQEAKEMERRLSDAVRNHPDRADMRRQLAHFLARRGDVERVARAFARAANSAPDAPPILVETANALSEAGYGEFAVPLTRRAILFSKNSPAAYEAAGNAYLAAGMPHEAAVKYAKAAGWLPDKIATYREKLGAFYQQRKEHPSDAERVYQQAVALQRATLGLPFNQNSIKPLLVRAITLDPKNTDYRRALLRVLVQRNEPQEAEKTAQDLLTLSPEDGLAHALLAVILLERPEATAMADTEAERHLKAAEEEDELLPTVHYGQGILALHRKQIPEAVRLLRKSAEEEPADRTYLRLAQAERLAGDTQAATKTMALFSARIERDRHAVDLMKQIAAQPDDRRHYDDAIAFFTRSGMKAQADAVAAESAHRFYSKEPAK